MTTECPNPVIRLTPLQAVRGWAVREYADGTFDACQRGGRLGLTIGCSSFAEAVAAAKLIEDGR